MEFRSNLGEVIRTLRRERGWTQGRVAKEAGYSTQSPLSKIENGQKGASFQEIWSLCEVLGYSLAEVENGMRAATVGRITDWIEELRLAERASAVSARRRWRSTGGSGVPDETGASGESGSDHDLLQTSSLFRGGYGDDPRADDDLMAEMVRGMTAFVRLLGRLGRSK